MLELAPYGSLATVLDELSSKREALENEGGTVSRIRESILGRELSYKIAFQVNFSDTWYFNNLDERFKWSYLRGDYRWGGGLTVRLVSLGFYSVVLQVCLLLFHNQEIDLLVMYGIGIRNS